MGGQTVPPRALLAGLVLAGLGLGGLSAAPPAPAAPLAQATPTPTPTAPPFLDFGNGFGVQPLPRAGVNCIVDTTAPTGVYFTCLAGTPVPTP